jgi:hypothetical protein
MLDNSIQTSVRQRFNTQAKPINSKHAFTNATVPLRQINALTAITGIQ